MEDHYLRKTAAQVDDLLDKIDGVEAHAQVNVQSDWSQVDTEADDFIKNKPNIPIVNDATLTIQRNGENVGTFTANQASAGTINILVPTSASDVNALPASTKYASRVELSINPLTFVLTVTLKDQDGNVLGTAQTVDLPLETVVVGGSYDSQTKKIILTLENGQTVEFSVADLVAGLQSEITSNNKLSADLVDDANALHKFVTSAEKAKLQDCKTVWQGTRAAYEALLVDEYDTYQIIEGASS